MAHDNVSGRYHAQPIAVEGNDHTCTFTIHAGRHSLVVGFVSDGLEGPPGALLLVLSSYIARELLGVEEVRTWFAQH